MGAEIERIVLCYFFPRSSLEFTAARISVDSRSHFRLSLSHVFPLPPPPKCSLRERIAAEERAKEQRLIEQFLARCAEDDRKQELALKAREEARMVRSSCVCF